MNTVSYTLNKTVFVLDKDTGALKSLEYPGVAPMVCGGGGLFDAAWPVHNEYDIQRADPCGKFMKCPPAFDFDGKTLTLTYENVPCTLDPSGVDEFSGGICAVVTLRAMDDGESVAMRLRIKNNSGASVEQVLFPNISGIVPTMDEDHAKLTMMAGSCNPFTELRSTPQSRETFFAWTEANSGRFYHAGGFQQDPLVGRWYDMGSRKGGFSMYRRHWGWGPDRLPKQTADMMGYSEVLWVKRDNLSGKVRLASVHYPNTAPGEEYDSGEYVMTAHSGNWIHGAWAYKAYVKENQHRVLPVPRRAREMLGFRTIFMCNGYLNDPTDYSWNYDDLPKVAEDMKEHGIYDLNAWSLYDYVLPFGKDCFHEQWGGFENCKKNIDKLHEMGITVTPLVSWVSAWDQTAKNYGIEDRSGSWAETPRSTPMFAAPYCKKWSCYQLHDHSDKRWQKDILDGMRFIRDELGCPDICWDQYVLGDDKNDVLHDIINEYRLETEKLYPGAVFSSECTLYYESDIDNTDFTWNWLYWPGRGDYRPYMYMVETLRPNMNVDSTPEYVKYIFMDNLMMNVYPSKPETYNGSALISEYPEFSAAVKTCAALRQQYLSYFADGLTISDTAVDGDIPCRVSGYFDREKKSFLMVVYKYNGTDAAIPFDLSYFTDAASHTWTITDEGANLVASGDMGARGEITVSGEKSRLYMIEIKAK